MLGLRLWLPAPLPPRLPPHTPMTPALTHLLRRPTPHLIHRTVQRCLTSAAPPPPPPPPPFSPPASIAHPTTVGRWTAQPKTAVERLYDLIRQREELEEEAKVADVPRGRPSSSPSFPSVFPPSRPCRISLTSAPPASSAASLPFRSLSGRSGAGAERSPYTFPPLPPSYHRPPLYRRRCGRSPPESHRHEADEEPCHAPSLYRHLRIYRYDPERGGPPWVDSFALLLSTPSPMLLDVLHALKAEVDPSLSFRRSCREGVCGSCAMNIDGRNGLACLHPSSSLRPVSAVFPLPHQAVIRDLVTDQSAFFRHYQRTQPWLQPLTPQPSKPTFPFKAEYPQSPAQRALLDGSYECILCACCSTACPEYWWKAEDGFLGPAALLHAYRWVVDSRDGKPRERLSWLKGERRLWECKAIANCAEVCPKHLNPALLIHRLKAAAIRWDREDGEEEAEDEVE